MKKWISILMISLGILNASQNPNEGWFDNVVNVSTKVFDASKNLILGESPLPANTQKKCDLGDPIACLQLGMASSQEDPSSALRYYVISCKWGNAQACYLAGDLYAQQKDSTKALQYFQASCKVGGQKGCVKSAILTLNPSEANQVFDTACQDQDTLGCIELGRSYAQGRGVENNEKKAKELFQKACDLGDNQGCDEIRKLGDEGLWAYSKIWLKKKNNSLLSHQSTDLKDLQNKDEKKSQAIYEKQLKAFEKQCNQDPKSCTNLALMYLNGRKVAKDSSKAIEILQSTCQSDGANGCMALGILYDEGTIVKKNNLAALNYYKKACELKLEKSCNYFEDLNRK